MVDSRTLPRLFSKSAPPIGEGADKTWRPLRFFNLYRFTLAALFILMFHLEGNAPPAPLGQIAPRLFYATSIIYLGFSLLAMYFITRRTPDFSSQVNTHVLADIAVITILMYSSGGIASGVGVLLIVSIAFASMLSTGISPLFYAALASLAVLGEQGFALISVSGARINFTHAGTLGIALFTTAIVAHVLARRARESEELAAQRGLDLANMAQLTEFTIQQMHTGVIVVDTDYRVRLINDAAWRLLGGPTASIHSLLNQYCGELQQQLLRWEQGVQGVTTTVTPTQGAHELLSQFLRIGTEKPSGTLIFLEDATAASQQAQQLKLASLGRLTASIAHEIRNPLGAISHASDLLVEAPELSDADQRLTAIIKKHSQRINTIIEDVLQLGRRDKSSQELFELTPWMGEFVEEFLHGEGQGYEVLTWHVEDERLPIFFDPNHLRQLLTNLCHNGLRHAADADNPKVELMAGSIDDNTGYIDIIDHGPGIPQEKRAHIFEPFFTTESSGSGLGLYIAREMAVCNQAQLRYVADQDSNSCFRLHFAKQRTTTE